MIKSNTKGTRRDYEKRAEIKEDFIEEEENEYDEFETFDKPEKKKEKKKEDKKEDKKEESSSSSSSYSSFSKEKEQENPETARKRHATSIVTAFEVMFNRRPRLFVTRVESIVIFVYKHWKNNRIVVKIYDIKQRKRIYKFFTLSDFFESRLLNTEEVRKYKEELVTRILHVFIYRNMAFSRIVIVKQ